MVVANNVTIDSKCSNQSFLPTDLVRVHILYVVRFNSNNFKLLSAHKPYKCTYVKFVRFSFNFKLFTPHIPINRVGLTVFILMSNLLLSTDLDNLHKFDRFSSYHLFQTFLYPQTLSDNVINHFKQNSPHRPRNGSGFIVLILISNCCLPTDPGSVHISLLDLDDHENTTPVTRRKKWPTGFLTQYTQLTVRTFKQSKSQIFNKFKVIEAVVMCILVCLIWFQLPRTEETLRDRMGVVSCTS